MWTLLFLLACGDDTTPADSGAAGDSGTPPADTFEPDLGLGTLTGDCNVLDDEWSVDDPFTFRNAVDLVGWDESLLSEGGQAIWEAGNLGGSSLESEVLAFEVLHACEGAALLRTEGEIAYVDDGGKKTDALVEIDGVVVGLSVTRAFHWPPEDPYTEEEAAALLEDKLLDVVASAENAAASDAWARSVLHVIAYDGQYADQVDAAWAALDAAVKGSHGVIVTVTDGDDEAIY